MVQSVGRPIDKGVITEPTKTNAGRRAVDLDEGSVDVLRAHIGRQVRLPQIHCHQCRPRGSDN